MDRLHKKCLVGSALLHGFLLLLLVFGSAFFVAKEKSVNLPRINVVPSRLVDDALAGGGGNPNLPRTDDQQKGQTLAPQPAPPPAAKVQPRPAPPEPVQPPVTPKETPKPVIAKAPAVKPPGATVKKPEPKPQEPVKPADDIFSQLKPVKPTKADREKARKEAEAQEKARRAAEAARQTKLAQERFAKALGNATTALQRGFQSGTKVEVGGPGGEAYASYDAFVQAAYYDAWQVQPDVADDDSVVRVTVTISRDGRVVESRIIDRSGSSIVDRSVQRALDRVRRDGLPPFPQGSQESERTYKINFNLKAKRLAG